MESMHELPEDCQTRLVYSSRLRSKDTACRSGRICFLNSFSGGPGLVDQHLSRTTIFNFHDLWLISKIKQNLYTVITAPLSIQKNSFIDCYSVQLTGHFLNYTCAARRLIEANHKHSKVYSLTRSGLETHLERGKLTS